MGLGVEGFDWVKEDSARTVKEDDRYFWSISRTEVAEVKYQARIKSEDGCKADRSNVVQLEF